MAALLAPLIAVAGCSGNDGRVAVYPVKGKVTVGGEVPEGALVVLHPTGGAGATEHSPSGKVKQDGSFSLTTYEAEDGAPAGNYVATIQWNKLIKKGNDFVAGPNAVAKEYGSKDSSPWQVTVESKPNELPPREIK
ncbi:hypothetical protein [Aquisphaera giovannonii]|nr:hypothetical protein [Aquisphaera giovannonii]